MMTFLAAFFVMGVAILVMAVGILVGRRPIGGSCGGLERLGLECDAGCDRPCPERLALLQAHSPSGVLPSQLTRPGRDSEAPERPGS